MSDVFDPTRTYMLLADGPQATPVPVGPDFWQTIDRRRDLDAGRLVTTYHFEPGRWDHWEMHPAGDEIVVLFAGAFDLVLDAGGEKRTVVLRGRAACIVPRGAWHTGNVHEPSDALFITRGAGTEHRARRTEES
jgi:hypothetical protein